MKAMRGPHPRLGGTRARRSALWLVPCVAALATLVSSTCQVGRLAQGDAWFQLNAILPGERVPDWLHTGRRYRGVVMPGGLVKLFAPDFERSALISAALLTEVRGYDA